MVLHNPNNWHWVNKDVAPWAKEYLETNAQQLTAEDDGVSAKITKLSSMDGDVDVSQRKGKVITIFDVSLRELSLWFNDKLTGQDLNMRVKAKRE